MKLKKSCVNRKLGAEDRKERLERDILKKAEANLVDERMRQHLSGDYADGRHSNLCFDMPWDAELDKATVSS